MTNENWIEIIRIVVDLLKTIIPFSAIGIILLIFKKEIKTLINGGGFKLAGLGFSVETIQKQQEKIGATEIKEIEALNSELKTSKQIQQRLQELQEYTSRDKDTFFLGYHFEKTYRLIFPSQMVILNVMTNSNDEITEDIAAALFRRTIWSVYYNVSFEQFINFLIHAGLIAHDSTNRKFRLTPLGRTFWEYLKKENAPLKIPPTDVVENPVH